MFLQFNFDGIISPRTGFIFNHVLKFFVVYTKSTQLIKDFNCVVFLGCCINNRRVLINAQCLFNFYKQNVIIWILCVLDNTLPIYYSDYLVKQLSSQT